MISAYKDKLNRQLGKKEVIAKQLETATVEHGVLLKRIEGITQAQVIIQKVATETQQLMVIRIEDIVNKVLATVFPEYTFKLDFEIKRGKSEASLKFYVGNNLVDIMDGTGGGVSDVAALALRLAVWSLSNTVPVLLLDEATKHLSNDLQPRIAEVLSELSHILELQMIMVSHSPPICDVADKRYTIELNKTGESIVV